MALPTSQAITRALIDLPALQHNLRRVREAAPGKRIMAIIKADAYGHGLVRIARALASGVDSLGVARLGEAVRLRDAGIGQSITLLEGFLETAELAVIVQHRLDVVVHRLEQIAILEQTSLKQLLSVWLKVDTGMHRLGIALSDAKSAWQRLQSCSEIKTLGVMTHLANADDRGDS
ncbi:MAG: alanine racemase, partial [Gammaproteobacteria bacterium]